MRRFNGPTPDFFLTNVNGGKRSPKTSAHQQDPSCTSDSHTAWLYQLELQWQVPARASSPFPHTQQRGAEQQLCPATSAGNGRHTRKLHCTLQDKDETSSYNSVQAVSILLNVSLSIVLNILSYSFYEIRSRQQVRAYLIPKRSGWQSAFWSRCLASIAFQKESDKR